VQAQITAEEKRLVDMKQDVSKSTSKDDKLNGKLQKTQANVNKVEATRMKEQTRNAKIQGDLIAAERKYQISNDVKDLKKVSKLREKLASGETKVAKLMEKEAKLHSTATKYSGDLPESAR
ncbi:MAG: hypothetical protein M3R08_08135, partial [Bacteroidota bacterium]|nr:hypothetical protein [Bacteroidota bacterium]